MEDNGKKKDKDDLEGEPEKDITKEAFFSDLGDMEEEIAGEAYELVAHALNLLHSGYYDDAIEIIRQAIGQYELINRNEEIKALNDKIAEIYVMKEQVFAMGDVAESFLEEIEETKYSSEDLLNEANQLVEIEEYEEALERYEETLRRAQEKGEQERINEVKSLIASCQHYLLTSMEQGQVPVEPIPEDSEEVELEEQFKKEQRVEQFEQQKQEEEQFQITIDTMIKQAQDLAREYEKIRFPERLEHPCPYPAVIDIYKQIVGMVEEREWQDQATQFSNQVKIYQDKLKNDEAIRKGESAKLEKEQFEETMEKMALEAEKKSREYEMQIKKKNFEAECPYAEIIRTYEEIRKIYDERGDQMQSNIAQSQIINYKAKLNKDIKLREIEAQKAHKDREFEQMMKFKDKDIAQKEIDFLKMEEKGIEYEGVKHREHEISKQIVEMTDQAEKLAREYKNTIKKGKFDTECPYSQIIEIYQEVKEKVTEAGWKDKIHLYANQIKIYQQELENDRRLREVEAQKVEKEKQYEEMYRSPTIQQTIETDKLAEVEHKKQQEKKFEEWIASMIDKADVLEREYDHQIKKGNFEILPPYEEIIEKYTEIKEQVKEAGWSDQVRLYANQIINYKQKLEKDKKLREIEAQKAEKDKLYEEMYKSAAMTSQLKIDKIMELEKEKKKAEQISDNALKLVDIAERKVTDYERKLKSSKDILSLETPYEEVISLYKEARKLFNQAGWNEEAGKLINTIKFYMTKQEKDNHLRDLEQQKKEELAAMREKPKESWDDRKKKAEKAIKSLEEKKQEEIEKVKRIFDEVEQVEQLVKAYELEIKSGNILELENPYEKVINTYRIARENLKKLNWNDQASQLITSINFYKERLERDKKLREIELKKKEKADHFEKTIVATPKTTFTEKKAKEILIDEKKAKEKTLSEQAFEIIDEAEKISKNYEIKLRKGEFPDCPFEEIIEMYRDARKIFEEIGWNEQASQIVGSINHYKAKLKEDKRLRALEAEKHEKARDLAEQKKSIAQKLTQKQKQELLEREKTLLSQKKVISDKENLKVQAFNLMDRAKIEFTRKNYDQSIKLYSESKEIFGSIDWKEGISMVNQSILMIKNTKKEMELRQRAYHEKQQKKNLLEKKLEERLSRVEELRKGEEKRKRKELLKAEEQKRLEEEKSENAYSLLERGTLLLGKKNFEEAKEKYLAARDIFKELNWAHEVSRINSDLLIKLKREQTNVDRLKTYKEKKEKRERELAALLEQAEKQKVDREKSQKEAKRKRLVELKGTDKKSQRIMVKLDEARDLINDKKYNQALLELNAIKVEMEAAGWKKEIENVNEQIFTIKQETEVPLIALDDFEEEENKEAFKKSYFALDKAQLSFSRGLFMKGISELSEARHNLQETKIGEKYIDDIDIMIENYREQVRARRELKIRPKYVEEKSEEEDQQHPIEGSKDFKVEKEPEVSSDEEELKKRIEARRAERRKKIRKRLEKENED